MKITLIHGTHATASRKRFETIVSAIRKRGWNISVLEEPFNLQSQLRAGSLFDANELYVIDGKLAKISEKDLQWLASDGEKISGNLLLYHDGGASAKLLKELKSVKIEAFPLPKLIFSFLDTIIVGNSKRSLQLLHQVLENEPVEFVFALLASLFRDLYWIKADPATLKLPPWRAQKLKRQSAGFSVEQLKKIISQLAEIDIKVKTSQADLTTELDLLIAKELE